MCSRNVPPPLQERAQAQQQQQQQAQQKHVCEKWQETTLENEEVRWEHNITTRTTATTITPWAQPFEHVVLRHAHKQTNLQGGALVKNITHWSKNIPATLTRPERDQRQTKTSMKWTRRNRKKQEQLHARQRTLEPATIASRTVTVTTTTMLTLLLTTLCLRGTPHNEISNNNGYHNHDHQERPCTKEPQTIKRQRKEGHGQNIRWGGHHCNLPKRPQERWRKKQHWDGFLTTSVWLTDGFKRFSQNNSLNLESIIWSFLLIRKVWSCVMLSVCVNMFVHVQFFNETEEPRVVKKCSCSGL